MTTSAKSGMRSLTINDKVEEVILRLDGITILKCKDFFFPTFSGPCVGIPLLHMVSPGEIFAIKVCNHHISILEAAGWRKIDDNKD